MKDYIDAVEQAHLLQAENKIIPTNLIHANAPEGEYHIKTGGLLGERAYYGLKANGGFFSNQQKHNLPNILGIIYLSDAHNAYPLAIFASSLISKMRTAAATAVAAKYLKPSAPIRLGVIGYGSQAEAQINALVSVADIECIKVAGRNKEKLANFVQLMQEKINIPIETDDIKTTCLSSNVIVTCTPSTKYFVERDWIQKGTFIAAVGADSPGKNELDPYLMVDSKIVADIKSQVIKVGESQHAINKNLINPSSIYCELGQLITGAINGRKDENDIFIYDSTGTAIQDVAAAAYIYEKLKDDPSIKCIDFFA
ncbi:MAG: ornithine cyclodeaminase family protein [Saprospiraceae bacterium]|nr:ornithine cyclodeaminase family protein [Saprospiraceae bacterium]